MKIKNLKINKEKLNTKFKLIKKKIKLNLTITSLALILAFSGNGNPIKEVTASTKIEQEENYQKANLNYNNNYEYNKTLDYKEIYNQIPKNFAQTKNFENFINNYEINYDYINEYNINNLLKKNETATDIIYQSTKNPITNGDQLCNIVIKNNKDLLNNSFKKNYYNKINYFKLKKICNIIMDTINKYIDSSNKNEVYTILNNLKILQRNITSNGYVDDNDTLVISENKSFNGESLENIVSHETIHLLQKNSIKNIEDGSKRIGICINFKDEKINSLNWSWFYEASAAACMENTLGKTSGSYKTEINYLNTLKLATILNSPSSTTLEEICNTKDINNLFNYFNCKTDDEKKELIAMMYSIEIINNKPKEIIELISNNTTINFSEMKHDIYLNITKYFYKNLNTYIKNKSINIEEIFSLINLFESNINYNLVTNYYKKFEVNEKFMKNYLDIQNQFLYQLAESLNIDYNTLYDSYINYTVSLSKSNSININNLNNDTNKWLNKQKNNLLAHSTSIIQEDYYNFYNKTKTK